MTTRSLSLIWLVWLAAALALGASGATERARPPLPQISIVVLTALLMIAFARSASLRDWVQSVDPRVLIAVHLTRFVGLEFLRLGAAGRLPSDWARPAGFGDIFVATLALILVTIVKPDGWGARYAYLSWNLLGLADILMVVVNAARSAMHDPTSMNELLHLPLSLLWTWLVPTIIATHVWMLVRFLRRP